MTKIAHEVVLDYSGKAGGVLFIDGMKFPFHVARWPEVDGGGKDTIPTVTVSIFADNIRVVSPLGETNRHVGPQNDELAWAREMAREVVRDGLAPVLRWIAEGRVADRA